MDIRKNTSEQRVPSLTEYFMFNRIFFIIMLFTAKIQQNVNSSYNILYSLMHVITQHRPVKTESKIKRR